MSIALAIFLSVAVSALFIFAFFLTVYVMEYKREIRIMKEMMNNPVLQQPMYLMSADGLPAQSTTKKKSSTQSQSSDPLANATTEKPKKNYN